MKMMLSLPRALRLAVASTALAVTFLAGASVSAVAQTARRLTVAPTASAARVPLVNSLGTRPAASTALGHLAGETQLLGMSLVIKPTAAQSAALDQLLSDQQNPSSASYHKWLTPAQYGAQFGLGDDDLAVLETWLQGNGFTVDSVAPSRNRIVFSGTASSVEAAFGTTMQRYSRGNQTFYENSTALQIPAALAGVISGISGLSSYHLPSPMLKHAPVALSKINPQYTNSTGTANYIVPWDIRQIYGTNTLISAGNSGTGIKIAVLGQSAVSSTQLTYFQQRTGQTVTLPTMTLVPSTGNSVYVEGDEGESELDLEQASGGAPGASVVFVYTGCNATITTGSTITSSSACTNNGVFDALSYAVTNNIAPILTLSYGGCEAENTSYANTVLEPILKQANTQGQTFFASSGDSGAASCEASTNTSTVASGGLSVSYPASSAYATGVGGTTVTGSGTSYWNSSNNSFAGSAIGYIPETAWNDTTAYGSLSASGGGASTLFAKPTWQAATGVPADNHRDVPDVALPAGVELNAYITCTADASSGAACTAPATGVTGFVNSGAGLVGGTSAAAPNWAAMLAVIEQANGGTALGNINPRLYTLAQGSSYSTVFHDITSGNNIVSCTGGTSGCSSTTSSNGTMGYSAGTGYDQVTGLGTPNVPNLQAAFNNITSKTPLLGLHSSSTSPAPNAAVTFTLNLSGTGSTVPTGTVQFAVDGTNVGSTVTIASGVATYSYSGFTSSGAHTVAATYNGDSNFNSGTATITITAASVTPSIALTTSTSTPVANTPVTFTATVSGSSGTPTGTTQFYVDGTTTGPAVTLVNGVASYVYPGFATADTFHSVSAVYGGTTTYSTVTSTAALVVPASTTATLTPVVALSLNPATPVLNGVNTFTATVTGSGSTPTGQVLFSIGGTQLPASAISSGTATTTYTFTTTGSQTVTASYSGDGAYKPASNSVTVNVVAPSFTMAFSPATLAITAGNTGTGTLTVTPTNGFTGTVGITYNVVATTGGTFTGCLSASSSSVPLTSTAAGTLSITVLTSSSGCSTTAVIPKRSALASNERGPGRGRTSFALISAAALFGCFFLRRRIRPGLLALVVLSAVSLGLAGCAGGGGVNTAAATNSSTGNYTITLTGTSGTATTTTSFTLTVQ